MEFKIADIFRNKHLNTATVYIQMDAKLWHEVKKNRQLGYLYGVTISNEVYRSNKDIKAYNPSVDDRKRANNGIKYITLTYPLAVNIY
jgi:hypothetical protein